MCSSPLYKSTLDDLVVEDKAVNVVSSTEHLEVFFCVHFPFLSLSHQFSSQWSTLIVLAEESWKAWLVHLSKPERSQNSNPAHLWRLCSPGGDLGYVFFKYNRIIKGGGLGHQHCCTRDCIGSPQSGHCRDERAERQHNQVSFLKLLLFVLGSQYEIRFRLSEDKTRYFKSTLSMQLRVREKHFLLHRLSENASARLDKLSQRGAFCGYR